MTETTEQPVWFLWHPGTENVFSGYGLAVAPNRPDHLVGLLMVDRPHPVPAEWLAQVEETFGGYQLYQMTVGGERAIACQMHIELESLFYLRKFEDPLVHELRIVLQLQSLVENPPQPAFRLQWEPETEMWRSSFYRFQALFPPGDIVATPGALEALEEAGQDPWEFLSRHLVGDWGELDPHDVRENELSLQEGFRLLSSYQTSKGKKLWIITESDRSVTTILLPSEY